MADEKLNFDRDDLSGFDAAGTPGDALAGFDSASGATFVPAGNYLCQLESGALVMTKAGKTAYRLRFAVAEPAEYAGFALWRYFVMGDRANDNRAKAGLAPLGLRTAADLRRSPFPDPGRSILCRVLVAVQEKPDGTTGNDVVRFTVERDDRAAPNPFAVPLDAGEGGTP
jgi:hypothetical protein